MNEIVEYHNDFHKLSLGNFSELEQNLLMGVLVNCRNQGDKIIKMCYDDVLHYVDKRKNITKKELLDIIINLRTNFFKLDFKVIKKQGNLKCEAYYNLFSKFEIYINEIENLEKQKLEQQFSHLILKVNDDFAYIINELTRDFTQFELDEFLYLRGKYSKSLYRLLKCVRKTGYYIKKWSDFKGLMGIPESMRDNMIETRILKPCVEKLSTTIKTHLFDARIPFENLEYKFKKESSKRGKPQVTHIEFYFKPQPASVLEAREAEINEQKAKKPIVEPNEPRYITELKELCHKTQEYEIGDDEYKFERVEKAGNNYLLIYIKNKERLFTPPLTYENAQKYLKAKKKRD